MRRRDPGNAKYIPQCFSTMQAAELLVYQKAIIADELSLRGPNDPSKLAYDIQVVSIPHGLEDALQAALDTASEYYTAVLSSVHLVRKNSLDFHLSASIRLTLLSPAY